MANININTSITQGGRVVVNAALDKEEILYRKTVDLKAGGKSKRLYGNSSTDDIYMHIIPGEPLFMYKKRSAVGGKKKRKIVRDTDLVVFSSLNGIIASKDCTPEEFESNLTFAGFADIQTLFDSEGHTRTDAVSQVGGLRTTVNTGTSHIRQGDKVYWKLPSAHSARGHSKLVAELHPLRKYDIFSMENLLEEMNKTSTDKTGAESYSTLRSSLEDAYDDVVEDATFNVDTWAKIAHTIAKKYFHPCYAEAKSRVIGTAMKSAKPGQEFDIQIGAYSI